MTEPWQRGPVEGVPVALQPVAHALLQVGESVPEMVADLAPEEWNERPAGVASPAFHVRHIAGVIDRLFTYARGDKLSHDQFLQLRAEADAVSADEIPLLLRTLRERIEKALLDLRSMDPAHLGDYRAVGRSGLPSTVIGCVAHAAEHAMRHVGQLSVTERVIRAARER